MRRRHDNRGLSLIELIIVIAIMGILVGVLSPMFVKYVDKSARSKDVYTADQIAKAVNIAFIGDSEAYDGFQKNTDKRVSVSATHNGVTRYYDVYLIASNGQQDTNRVSNCFNGGATGLFKRNIKDGSTGFYSVVNRELGLSTTQMNSTIIPKHKAKKEGAGIDRGGGTMVPFAEVDRWRIVRRADNNMMEIWVAQPNPWGGYPIYRLWPEPDDEYTK